VVWVGEWYDGLTRSALGSLARSALVFLARCARVPRALRSGSSRVALGECVLVVSGGVRE
jgi:hypothetical protein